MHCDKILFSDHAVSQMFKRDIEIKDVHYIVSQGQIIKKYLHDRPYPSFLLLGYINKRPLHLVIAEDKQNYTCVIITAYEPDKLIWNKDFKTKRN